ncbi:MAG TPA: hypothetical protein VHW60_13195 [Caulobacteraceae bacterium]|jgi:hypothetical protein|nr:hypothetical protein [Caulobacteraceae bacterium]
MSALTPVGLGFRAGRGGSVVVAVAADGSGVRVVRSTYLATAAEGDRLAYEPYHVAYEMPRRPDGEISAEAAAAVAEGRRRQVALAPKALRSLVASLADAGYEPVRAALLINRAGWMTDLLGHALSAPEHPPVIEGLAVRVALRAAFTETGLAFIELDEKSLLETVSIQLPLPPGGIDAQLKALGAGVGPPWRKEQKQACLAAWLALAAR